MCRGGATRSGRQRGRIALGRGELGAPRRGPCRQRPRRPQPVESDLRPGAGRPPRLYLLGGGLRRARSGAEAADRRSEEHTSELQSHSDLVCRLLLEKKKTHTLSDLTLRCEKCPRRGVAAKGLKIDEI